MKRTISAICTLALAAGISASCQKTIEQAQKNGLGSSRLTVTATIADKGTKVTYSEDASSNLKPTWAVGDTIIGFDNASNTYAYKVASVDNSTGKATLEIVTGSGKGTAMSDPADGAKMYMFYAPGKKASDISGNSLTVSLASQSEAVVPALMMASATVSGGSLSLSFTKKTAIIGIKNPTMGVANKAYTSIALSGTGINTEVKFEISGGELVAAYQTAGTIAKAVDFSSGADKGTTATVYIAACPLASPANLTFTASNGEEVTQNSRTMAEGNYYYMSPTFDSPAPLSGEFSVSETKKIKFSRGNLIARINANGEPIGWGFAANQYDFLGAGGANGTIGTKAGDIDLFGFSTVDGTKPWGISVSEENADYSGAFKDWGENIGDGNTYCTISEEELCYLFNGSTREGLYAAGVTVLGVEDCVILYPDGYTGERVDADNKTTLYTNETTWASAQNAGVVCLPPAGYRSGVICDDVGSYGYFWTSTPVSGYETMAWYLNFGGTSVYPDSNQNRQLGSCVRLITTVSVD